MNSIRTLPCSGGIACLYDALKSNLRLLCSPGFPLCQACLRESENERVGQDRTNRKCCRTIRNETKLHRKVYTGLVICSSACRVDALFRLNPTLFFPSVLFVLGLGLGGQVSLIRFSEERGHGQSILVSPAADRNRPCTAVAWDLEKPSRLAVGWTKVPVAYDVFCCFLGGGSGEGMGDDYPITPVSPCLRSSCFLSWIVCSSCRTVGSALIRRLLVMPFLPLFVFQRSRPLPSSLPRRCCCCYYP